MDSFAPAVGAETAILPLLNGMRHLEVLDGRFGTKHALGGECLISATLAANGGVIHLNDVHTLLFGERNGAGSERVQAIASAFSQAKFDGRPTNTILQEMWEKWVFIAAAAGITCLMRATVGDIVAAGAAEFASTLLEECAAIAARLGFAPRETFLDQGRRILTAADLPLTASMLVYPLAARPGWPRMLRWLATYMNSWARSAPMPPGFQWWSWGTALAPVLFSKV
jgi:2-dehydropantoate 2-reductase